MDQNQHLSQTTEAQCSEKKKTRCCDKFKLFLAALSFAYICKTIGGSTMKSFITQIEKRFDISATLSGLIDGSFEIGNVFVIVFVSYFGSKLHRPKIIGIGCFIMGAGSVLTALPHFFMGYYRYSKETFINSSGNSTSSLSTCLINQALSINRTSLDSVEKGCGKEDGSHMWVYVLMGNVLRGIGEAPVVPLGVSYIDDFAKEGHSSLYVGGLSAVAMIGSIIGFTLGSLFAKLYVDIGYVDLSTIRITPNDSRWVGAWWLGFLLCGLLSFISSIPFFFLPSNINKPQKERETSISSHVFKTNEERNTTENLTSHGKNDTENVTGFFQSLKSILTNAPYVMLLFSTLVHFSSFIGSFTYIFKYLQQQYNQSASQINFLLGILALPTIATGLFLGGYIIKKFKLTLVGTAKFALYSSVMSWFFQLIYFALVCESKPVAGLTLTYDRNNPVASHIDVPFSYCNSDCNCDVNQWEPVCGNNGITYMSPCLAGCKSSSGNTKPIVFYSCSCVEVTGSQNKNYSAHLGECSRDDTCTRKFYIYVAVQVLNFFFFATGCTPCAMMIIKIVPPELKSLAVGFHALVIRTVGGILSPIYFGSLIDITCMKWFTNSCGARGSCRIYNSTLFGRVYLGLTSSLSFLALLFFIISIFSIKKKYQGKDINASENERKEMNETHL
ncbi:solute carrier organic anion transporter family member 1B3-like [Carlito syrichta]|uniref:Solute carrier organic anion transporter family member n=1 Tax=Carlito syrichta TaxID=1868482 RepID=A0A1U7T1W4_CARSF|nr:solute carrier organic anion transporter family member 1B3-like [Carlito syrichta]